VHPSDKDAVYDIVHRIAKFGHKRIAYLKFDFSEHYSVQARRDGYESAMAKLKLASIVVDRHVDGVEQPQVMHRLLSQPDRPTAFIVRPEEVPTLCCVAAGMGLSAPRDFSIVTLTGYRVWVMGQEVSSSCLPTNQMGREAVRMLLRRLQDATKDQPPVRVPFECYDGTTLGPPPRQ
jgi:DNA-binding LacI/PurR family transcriptional regulator